MDYTIYACGFNGFQQLDSSIDGLKKMWVNVGNGTGIEPLLSVCWDSLYIINNGGEVQKNGRIISSLHDFGKEKIVQLSAAEDRLVALCSDGLAYLHGPSWRRLALQSAGRGCAAPVRHVSVGRHTIAGCDSEGSLLSLSGEPGPAGESVRSVSCGREHTVLVTRSGRVYAGGGGSRGQLGDGLLTSSDQYRLVGGLDGLAITQAAAGGWHTAALSESGDVYCWGWNESGQLGLDSTVNVSAEPRLVDALPADSRVTQVCCGARHTLALLEDGSVWGWGWAEYGQLPSAADAGRCEPRRLPLPPGSAVRIAAGGWNSAVVMAN